MITKVYFSAVTCLHWKKSPKTVALEIVLLKVTWVHRNMTHDKWTTLKAVLKGAPLDLQGR